MSSCYFYWTQAWDLRDVHVSSSLKSPQSSTALQTEDIVTQLLLPHVNISPPQSPTTRSCDNGLMLSDVGLFFLSIFCRFRHPPFELNKGTQPNLYHMFGSEPDFKMHVQNLACTVPSPCKLWPRTTQFRRFSTTSQLDGKFIGEYIYLQNETWYRQSGTALGTTAWRIKTGRF